MLFLVKTLTGRKIQFESDKFDKIIDIKERISEMEGIDVKQIRLIMVGKMVNDLDKVNELITNNNQILHMVLSLRGG